MAQKGQKDKDLSVATSVMVLCPVCAFFIPCGDPKASPTSFKLRLIYTIL